MQKRMLSFLMTMIFLITSCPCIAGADADETNVFLGAVVKVNHSAAASSLSASNITDGDAATRYSETNNATGNLVITITLDNVYALSGITLTERIGNYNRLGKKGLNVRVEYTSSDGDDAIYTTEGEYNLPYTSGSAGVSLSTPIDFGSAIVAKKVRLTVIDPFCTVSAATTSEPNRKSQIEFFEIEGFGKLFEPGGNLMFYVGSPRVRIGDELRFIDANNTTAVPLKIGNSTMLPSEFLAEATGADISETADGVRFTLGGKSAEFECDSKICTSNGNTITLADAPVMTDWGLYVPVKAVCDSLCIEYNEDECGIVIVGDGASDINWTDEADFEELLSEMRDIVYYQIPTPEEVISKLKEQNPDNAHPRLLIKGDEVDGLRNLVNTEEPYKSWMEQVLSDAQSYIPQSFENLKLHYELEDGIRLLSVSRRAQKYITNLSFAYLMTGDETYARKAIDIMLFLGSDEFPDWHPYHFLDVAEMAAGVAIGYDWCYGAMTEEEKATVKNILVEYALKPVMEDYNGTSVGARTWQWSSPSSSAYPQNWISVCFGGTTLASLAVGDEDLGTFKEAGNVITEGMERMKDWFDRYMPDGVCVDGGLYWLLAMNYNTFGINAMETALGTSFNLSSSPGFARSFDWLIQLMGHGGAFNISGAPSEYSLCADSPEFHWWSQKTGDGSYSAFRLDKSIGEWNCSPSYKDIIWYKKDIAVKDKPIQMDYINRNNMSFVTMKSGTEKLDTWLGMYTGTIDKSGGYDEEGSFALDMLGRRWAVMLGTEGMIYSSSDTPREDYYRHRAEGENTLMINPDSGKFFDNGNRGTELKRIHNDASSIAVYDFSGLLKSKGGNTWHRGIRLDRENMSVTVQDELLTDIPSEMYWFMHTDAEIEISSDGKSAILSKDRRRVMTSLTADGAELNFEVMAAEPLPTSPDPEQESNDGFQKLAIHAEGITKARFAVEFVPLYSDGTHSQTHPFTSLDEWTLKQVSETDDSLKLTDIRINGKTISGFSPDKKAYTHVWLQGEEGFPDITASSDGGEVTVTNPDGENTVAVITVTNKENPSIKNEYFIEFYDYINPDNLFEGQNVTVNVAAMNAYLPKSAITDGDDSTRYSTGTKPGKNVVVEINPKNGCWYLEGISIGEYFSTARKGRAGITAKIEYLPIDQEADWQIAAENIKLPSKNSQGYMPATVIGFENPVIARSVRISVDDPLIATNPAQISFYEIEGYGKMYYPGESSYALVKDAKFVVNGVVSDSITDEADFAVRAVCPKSDSTLLAGCYNSLGKLICAGVSESGGDISMNNPDRENISTLKIYVWESAENMKPICKAFEMSVDSDS